MGKLMALFVISVIISVIFVGCISPKPSPTPPEGSIRVHRVSSEIYELELRVTKWPEKSRYSDHVSPLSFWYKIRAKKGIKSINFSLTSPTVKEASDPVVCNMIEYGDEMPGKIQFKMGETISGEKYKIFINGEVISEEGNKEIIYEDFFLDIPGYLETEFEMYNWISCDTINIGGVEVEWWVSDDNFKENETFKAIVRATTKKDPEYDIKSEYFNIYLLLCTEDDSIIEIKKIIAGPHIEEVHIAVLEKKLEPDFYKVYLASHIGTDPPEAYEHFAGPKNIKVWTYTE